ncbi:MAG: hypothetical protein GX648_08380 [Crenarchaeota archaeon]|nr:hypothetical protein [Thermoproteota archaeon]
MSLWKGKEEQYLTFTEINIEMAKKGWYVRKVIRRLEEMLKQRLVEKTKNGRKGAQARYKPTVSAHEFDANSFFERIRQASIKTGLFFKKEASLFVYGMPSKEKLTNLECLVLDHALGKIEDAFEKLFLLKQSINARETNGQAMDEELLVDFVKENIAERFGNMIYTEAELKLSEETRKGEFHGLAQMMIRTAEKSNVIYGDSDEIIEEEKRLLIRDSARLERPIYVPKVGYDADLAIMKTLSPNRLAEFELDPFGQLQKLIESWEPTNFDKKEGRYVARNQPFFDDADLYYIAEAFVRHMTPAPALPSSQEWLTVAQIDKLADCGWLTLKLGAENHEKLIRCIYHFWKEHQARVKLDKETEETWLKLSLDEKEELLEPHEFAIKIEEVDLTKIERITQELSATVQTKMPVKLERKFVRK